MLQGAAEEPPATPSSQRYCRALAARLPVLEPVLRVLQPGLQMPDAHLLLLQGGQVLLRGGRLDAMVVTAQRVLHGAPAGDACQQGGRKGPGEALCLQELGAPPTHPGPLATGALRARPPPRGPCGHENTQPLWEVGFIKALSSTASGWGAQGSSSLGWGDTSQSTCTSLAPPGVAPPPPAQSRRRSPELRCPLSQPRDQG